MVAWLNSYSSRDRLRRLFRFASDLKIVFTFDVLILDVRLYCVIRDVIATAKEVTSHRKNAAPIRVSLDAETR